MTDENKPPEATPEVTPSIKWVRPPQGAFETYANRIHTSWTLDDISLLFAQMIETDETLGPGSKVDSVSVLKASITISWRGAKILHRQLGQIIGNYEQVNGEINLTPILASTEGT